MPTSMFEKLLGSAAKANASQGRYPFFGPGDVGEHLVEVTDCKIKISRTEESYWVATVNVLESDNPSVTGMHSVMAKLSGPYKDMGLSQMKGFLLAMLGTLLDERPRESEFDVDTMVEGGLVGFYDASADPEDRAASAREYLLAGLKVLLTVTKKKTKKGQDIAVVSATYVQGAADEIRKLGEEEGDGEGEA